MIEDLGVAGGGKWGVGTIKIHCVYINGLSEEVLNSLFWKDTSGLVSNTCV